MQDTFILTALNVLKMLASDKPIWVISAATRCHSIDYVRRHEACIYRLFKGAILVMGEEDMLGKSQNGLATSRR